MNCVKCNALKPNDNCRAKLHITKIFIFFTLVVALLHLQSHSAWANNNYTHWSKSKRAVIVYDIHGDRILYSRNADRTRYPASLTKVMTLYVLFDQLKQKKLKLSTKMKVSKRASRKPASRLGLRSGSTITVELAIKSLIVKSANDVASVVAEHISGSESKFATLMTKTARKIGMKRTTFKNASGLPNRYQTTTARDMITMAKRVMKDFPEYYQYFDLTSFIYKKRKIYSHNRVNKMAGVDGLKTGYTRASGYNLVSSRKDKYRHIVAVVLGAPSSASRNRFMRSILTKYLPKSTKKRKKAPVKQNQIQLVSLPQPRPVEEKSKPSTLAQIIQKPKAQTKLPPKTSDTIIAELINKKNNEQKQWGVQIGVSNSEEGATRLLFETWRDDNNKKFAEANPIIEEISRSGKIYYRSRFVELSHQQANKACNIMKKNKQGCYVFQMR